MPSIETVKAKISSLRDEIGSLRMKEQRGELTRGELTHLERLETELDKHIESVERAKKRQEVENRVRSGDPSVTLHPGIPGPSGPSNPMTSTRDSALAEIDRYSSRGDMSSEAADRLDTLVRENDYTGSEARYITAVSSDHYRTAFGKMLAHPYDAHLRWTPREAESFHTVQQVSQERAMQEGLTTAGGFGVPTFVDPSLMLNSNGAINPIRRLARSITINTNKWTGVAGAVTASFDAELAEVDDGTPTLAGPSIDVRKAHVFVPFSIEVGEDYENLTRELGRAISDSKDVLEAQKFLDGLAAANEPVGIVSTSGALTTSQRVLTNTTTTLAIADVYNLKQALPARHLPQGQFTVHPTTLDTFRRFVGGGNTTEPFVVENNEILNRPTAEWSTMVNGTTAGSKVAIFADWQAAFAVVDRVGMSIELVPHLFGGSQRPIGARGVYAYWRVGSGVLVPNVARYLEVK